MTERLDETTPGGRYHNQDGTRWIDANGNDLGPVDEKQPETDANANARPAKPAPKAKASA